MASTLLEEALDGWRYAREGVIAEFENIPADKFDFRPAAGTRSVAELAAHIVESGAMMAGELSRPDGNFRRQPYPAVLKEHAPDFSRAGNKDGWIQLLQRSHEEGNRKIREAG